MLHDKIGKFFNIMATPISHNGNVKRDLWTLDTNYNITSQIEYPFLYDQNSIQELLVKFNKVKFKDISSMNLLPKQKYSNRFLFKMPDLKRDSSYHSKLYNYNLTTLEENDHKMNKKGSINNGTRKTKKKKQREKYFKIQLSDTDKMRSIKFDLHPMVEEFMNRTMDKLTANIPKEKQYKRKTKKRSDDEDEVHEKLRIMQVLKDLQKEEEEEKKRKEQSSQLLSVSSNLPTSDDLFHEDYSAGKIQQTRTSLISSSLPKSVNSSGLQTVSTSEQLGAVFEPINSKTEVIKIDRGVDDLERELNVFDPGNSDSPAADNTSQVNVSEKVEKKPSQLLVPNNVRKQKMKSKKSTIFNRKEIGVLYDSHRDKTVKKNKKGTKKADKKNTNNLDVQNADITQNNKSVINIDKSTSSDDLMKKDATTITEPNSKTEPPTTKKKILHFSDADHIMYPLYNIQESRNENNIYKQIEISPLKKHKKINIIENNTILNLEQTGKNTITDLQFSHHKIPNKNMLYFNYKSPLFQIKWKEFLKNNPEEKRKDLINGRSTGNVEIPYRLNRGYITGIPNIKEENSLCYNNVKKNITKKHSRISTIKKSKIIRKLAATCAYPTIKFTNVGDAKSYNKGNKLYFNSKVLLNSGKTNKIDKTIVNQCVNGINKKNEIAQTLRRINSLRDASDNLENFLKELKELNRIKDEPRIGTIVPSHFKESRTRSGNSNSGKQKHSDGVRNEPPNKNKHKFPKNCKHIIMPVYINIDTLNNWESFENENSSETNSVSSKTFPKTTMIPAAPKRIYLENFRKPNKEIVNKLVNAEQRKQYNNSFFLNENADREEEEIKSMKLYNSIAQCLTSKKIIESTMFENSIEQRIDYDSGTEKQETCNTRNSEERYEIIQIAGSNAVTESDYLLSNENSNSNNQSTIQLNVNRQNFKTVDFNSHKDLYTNKFILPKCINNLIINEEQNGQENYVNNEINDDKNIFEQQKNSNKSKQSITNSNGNNNYFKYKNTKQILQENQPFETTDPVNQRKPNLIEIYETSSKKTISQSSGRSEFTQPFYGNLSNSTIVCNKINSSYIDTIYANDSEKNISSTTKIFENNTLNSGYSKHEEVYNVNNDQNNANDNEKIAIEHIPLLNIEEYDTYSTGNSTNKLIHCIPSAISICKNSNFSNQTENTESITLLFSLNSEFYINETNTNKSMNMLNEKSMMMNYHNHEENIKLENKSPSGSTYETLSQQSPGKDNIVDKPVNDVNNKGYYFNKEISKENFKQTIGAFNKSIANFNDDVYEKCIRNSISVVYV